ncbi:MAG: hypothetical protein HN683_04710 [Gammaproteobacteria bacterium]|jgi:hypothetical protein|nr:hypothetical protein [Gammaproteobacteria bacterium]
MLTTQEINTKITGVRTSVSNLRTNMQVVLVNLAGHTYEHGDVRAISALTKRLLDNSLQGVDIKAVVTYLRDYCFVHPQEDGTVKLNKKARTEADFADGDAVVQHLMAEVPAWYTKAQTVSDALKDLNVPKSILRIAENAVKTDKAGNVAFNLVCSPRELDEALTTLATNLKIRRDSDNRVSSEIKEGRLIEQREEGVAVNA